MRKKMIVAMCFAVLAVACGQGELPGAAPTTTPPPSPEETSPEPESPSPPAAEVTVRTSRSDLGTIITDADGRTLYVFLNDSGGESSCFGDCAQTWPPLEVEGETRAGGRADASLLGTTERAGGAVQVTYGDRPLYYFAGDGPPGDTNGQGIGGVWYVVSPRGEPIRG